MRGAKKHFISSVLFAFAANFGFFYSLATPLLFQSNECSEASTVSTNIAFINNSNRTVSIYWVDFECEEEHYYTLLPSHVYSQQTYTGHRWIVRDTATGEFIVGPFVVIDSTPIVVNIERTETAAPTVSTPPKTPTLTTTEATEIATVVPEPGRWSASEIKSSEHGTITVDFVVSDDGKQAEVEVSFTDFAGCGVTTSGTMTMGLTGEIEGNILSLETAGMNGAEYELTTAFTSPITSEGTLAYKRQECEIDFLWEASLVTESVDEEVPVGSVSGAAIVPVQGEWTGTTSQELPISFTITETGITKVSVDFSFDFTACEISGPTFFIFEGIPITENSFSAPVSPRVIVIGTFSSDTMASGTVQVEVDTAGCKGSEEAAWTATVEVPADIDTTPIENLQAGQWEGSGDGDFPETVTFTVTEQGTITDFTFQVESTTIGVCILTFNQVEMNSDGTFIIDTDPDSLLDRAATIEGKFDSENTLTGIYSNPLLCDGSIFGVINEDDRVWNANPAEDLEQDAATQVPTEDTTSSSPVSGKWSGHANNGLYTVSFEVTTAGNQIAQLAYQEAGKGGVVSLGAYDIVDQSFSAQLTVLNEPGNPLRGVTNITVAGTFTSPTSVEGTFAYQDGREFQWIGEPE